MIKEFKDNLELFEFARSLRDVLKGVGRDFDATELSEVVDTPWTTASEALGELKLSLSRVRSSAADCLTNENIQLIDLAIRQITEAFDRANNP